jgi:hypothetical protein
MPTSRRSAALDALGWVLGSVEAVRNGPALFVLLGSFAAAGLLLAMAEAALAREALVWGAVQAGASLTTAFYGSNAAGLLLMDEACGRAPRDVAQALRDALASAHRLLLVLLALLLSTLLLVAVLCAGLWAARWPLVGPLLFGALVPLGVVVLGGWMLAAVTVVGPLAAPAIWSGRSVRGTLELLWHLVRRRLLFVALLTTGLSALTALVAAMVTFAVMAGGRAVAALAVLVTGIDLPPQQLMAGLFGYGLRSLGAAGAPVTQSAWGAAALVGGGMVFALALVLPGLVYLRGACAVYLALDER